MRTTENSLATPERDTRIIKCTIVLDHDKGQMDYDFEGEWRGRDAKSVTSHFFRKYREHMRKIRSEATRPTPEPKPKRPKVARKTMEVSE